MTPSLNERAWQFLCARYHDDSHWFDEAVDTADRPAFEHLVAIRAVKSFVTDNRFVLCPCCGLQAAELYRACGVLELKCPDCGPVRIFEGQLRAWTIDADWFVRKHQGAIRLWRKGKLKSLADCAACHKGPDIERMTGN